MTFDAQHAPAPFPERLCGPPEMTRSDDGAHTRPVSIITMRMTSNTVTRPLGP